MTAVTYGQKKSGSVEPLSSRDIIFSVGQPGLEPGTPSPPDLYANHLRYCPTVITSYSIHYTKLYEVLASAGRRFTAEFRQVEIDNDRINREILESDSPMNRFISE